MSDEVDLALMQAAFGEYIPHQKALGFVVLSASRAPATSVLKLPWNEKLVGNPATGVLHGGAITTLLDSVSGISVQLMLDAPEPIATLDLRVDFLSPAPAHRDVFARAECHRLTSSIAFTRGWAWTDDESKPFAVGTATFMRTGRGEAISAAVLREKFSP